MSKHDSRPDGFKTISYRGGLVTFSIPSHWCEEYAPDGGAAFYADEPNSPTFRLETMTLQSQSHITPDDAVQLLSKLHEAIGRPIERLSSGYAMTRFVQTTEERGQPLCVTYWLVCQILPPHKARIATFSYTLLDEQRSDARYQSELEMLDNVVRECRLHADGVS